MPRNKIDQLVKRYINAAELHGQATLRGDDKLANKQVAKLLRLYQQFEDDRGIAESALQTLFAHSNISVRVWASAHALGLGIQTDEAVRLLEQAAMDHNLGIMRLDAEMTLKEWRRKGGLKF